MKFIVHILYSEKFDKHYTGFASSLAARINHIMNLEMIGLLDTGHGELILRNLKVRLKQRRMENG